MELPEKLTSSQRKRINELKVFGLTPDTPEFEEIWQEEFGSSLPTGKRNKVAEDRRASIREAEAVLISLNSLNTVREIECKICKRKFMTNYASDKHCSEECLAESLSKVGLDWNPDRTQEDRWKGEPPSKLAPETVLALKDWAKKLLKNEIDPREKVTFSLPVFEL